MPIEGLDRSVLIRALVAADSPERATALALAGEGAARETGLGWIELGLGRPERAALHFGRARELAPGSSDAETGLLASQARELARGGSVAGISESDLDDRRRALIAGWRRAASNDWDAVAALDLQLGRFEPGDALFEEASRLRARWRLARKDAQAAVEAQAIMERLLRRDWKPLDALLQARAALAAKRPAAAWGALCRIAAAESRSSLPAPVLVSALEIARELPEDLARDARERLVPKSPRG
jgi:hypothetical protein